MNNSNKYIKIEEAEEEIIVALERIALLHLAYVETLVKEFGNEKGKQIAIEAIFNYGDKIGKRVLKGKKDLPSIGVYKEEVKKNKFGDFIVRGCKLARVFKEYNQEELGALYCYVDSGKSMAIDKSKKVIHKTCEACGDEECTLSIIDTTEEEQENFKKRINLNDLDPYLLKNK